MLCFAKKNTDSRTIRLVRLYKYDVAPDRSYFRNVDLSIPVLAKVFLVPLEERMVRCRFVLRAAILLLLHQSLYGYCEGFVFSRSRPHHRPWCWSSISAAAPAQSRTGRRGRRFSSPPTFVASALAAAGSVIITNGETTIASSSSSSAPGTASSSSPAPVVQFTTPPMQVYIEDTDAYGIVYNPNYLRAFDRALHQTSFDDLSSRDNSSNTTSKTNMPLLLSDVLKHEGWSIVAVDTIRYQASAPLGGSFVITGEMVDTDGFRETWNLVMTSVDGKTVYNTATGLQIARPPVLNNDDAAGDDSGVSAHWLPPTEPLTVKESLSDLMLQTSGTATFPTYRDEFDPHLASHPPLTCLLKLFERGRSDLLGGPDVLRRLQHEDHVLTVVTGNRDLTLVDNHRRNNNSEDDDKEPLIYPGQSVTVQHYRREQTARGDRFGVLPDRLCPERAATGTRGHHPAGH